MSTAAFHPKSTGLEQHIDSQLIAGIESQTYGIASRIRAEVNYDHPELRIDARAMSTPQAQAALRLLTLITRKVPEDFSGVGIVIYDSLLALPFLPLDVGEVERFNLPVSGLDAVGDVLARTARRSTHWHDGFHFLHAESLRLTHLCQFISPPLPNAGDLVPRASGARHMTGLLASRVAGIVAVAILTQERVASIYESGDLTKSEPLS